jgi:hypothetical protein
VASLENGAGARYADLNAKDIVVRYFRGCLLLMLMVAATLLVATCKQKTEPPATNNVGDEPPLLLEDPPLLLEDGNDQEPEGPMADNSRCHVCHINYADEELAVQHARADISCEQCHGSCDAHCSDEDNITPPDIMYPLEKINSFCMSCHPKDAIDTQPHEALLAGTATENKYCTDCHGTHRLEYRTRRWDKTTGELTEDDKVRVTTDEMPQ